MAHGPRFEALVAEAKTRIREISAEDAAKQQAQGVKLIDVREADEFAKEHATGATHLSKGIIEVKIEKEIPDTKTPIIFYCGGGISATMDALALLLLGHPNVAVYDGSLSEWARDPTAPMETGE